MVAEQFSARHPELQVTFLNRGVSADRVRDLRDRWQVDCLSLEPDVVSILVGVNDALGTLFWGEFTSLESFEADYSSILELTRRKLDAQIVLLEPFLLPMSMDLMAFRRAVDSRIDVVRKLSEKFETVLVCLDSVFSEAVKREKPEFWSVDGVHPTAAGHGLIARSWLEGVGV
jgi:lysophospholipase L1-like esterase